MMGENMNSLKVNKFLQSAIIDFCVVIVLQVFGIVYAYQDAVRNGISSVFSFGALFLVSSVQEVVALVIPRNIGYALILGGLKTDEELTSSIRKISVYFSVYTVGGYLVEVAMKIGIGLSFGRNSLITLALGLVYALGGAFALWREVKFLVYHNNQR